jgi:DNA processing protein
MADATIVVETAIKGGSMITAELANGYNRDVFAYPEKLLTAKVPAVIILLKIKRRYCFLKLSNWLKCSDGALKK